MHRRVTRKVSNLRRKILFREKLARYTLFVVGIRKKIILPETVKKKREKRKILLRFYEKAKFSFQECKQAILLFSMMLTCPFCRCKLPLSKL